MDTIYKIPVIEPLTEKLKNVNFSTEPPDYIRSINPILSTEAEMSFEAEINMPLFNRLVGLDSDYTPDASVLYDVTFKSPYTVQVRRHKKRRINKKWNKKYGPKYTTHFKNVVLENVRIERE